MSLLEPQDVQRAKELVDSVKHALGKVLLDQGRVIELVTLAILARGHVLLEGLPGLGKTELAKGLARLLGLPFKRVQFTPDLLPADITGTYVLDGERKDFSFRPGPLFASFVLADEINRAPPKTQAALLEAMQEGTVTVLGQTHALPRPFFVVATQNPIELEGTYPLPEAQLDRFMFRVVVPPVSAATVATLIRERPRGGSPELPTLPQGTGERLLEYADRVHVPAPVADYMGRLIEATQPRSPRAPEVVQRFVRFGASPRAGLALAAAARVLSLASGRPHVGFEDARALLSPVLAHRLVLSHEAQLDRLGPEEIVTRLLAAVPEAPGA